ncbi:hypothetical protein DERP_007376 [Dermatophagoides pteronyssinus]|uniref:Core Histone H2A/H2B/H3 domain-containing protein n=1 Tax=Dermatophagoides pteronyssinus TaxID=6956 RepID=A0ABQ8J4D4_DERPT|nr:hypothetical protein DERP_007376 [Dermatophagoides pteronyssinus]
MTRTNEKVWRKCSTPHQSFTMKKRRHSDPMIIRKRSNRKNRALQEIKFYQKTVGLLIPRLSFMRLVKQILDELRPEIGYRWNTMALFALQEMTENYMVTLFEDLNVAALHTKRITIKVEDMELVRRIRGLSDICNR